MALLIRKGLARLASQQIMEEFILHGWQQELKDHFLIEEQLLVPLLAGRHLEEGLLARMIEEHDLMRAIIENLSGKKSETSDLHTFAETLEKHIRFEERVLFPAIEAVLTEDELAIVGRALEHIDDQNCMSYPIRFWE